MRYWERQQKAQQKAEVGKYSTPMTYGEYLEHLKGWNGPIMRKGVFVSHTNTYYCEEAKHEKFHIGLIVDFWCKSDSEPFWWRVKWNNNTRDPDEWHQTNDLIPLNSETLR